MKRPIAVRAGWRARLASEGAAALYAELGERDPESAAKIRPQDGVRIARALEVFQATGRTLSDWHRSGMPALVDPAATVNVFLTPDRAELYRRIDARLDAMIAAGALEEVRALDARGLDPLHPAMKAHGVENLYVASSSVFPTTGQANSTLLAVAFAVRLAERLVRAGL